MFCFSTSVKTHAKIQSLKFLCQDDLSFSKHLGTGICCTLNVARVKLEGCLTNHLASSGTYRTCKTDNKPGAGIYSTNTY